LKITQNTVNLNQHGESAVIKPVFAAEHNMIIDGITFHVRSVFIGKVRLDDALKNIAIKKQAAIDLPEAG